MFKYNKEFVFKMSRIKSLILATTLTLLTACANKSIETSHTFAKPIYTQYEYSPKYDDAHKMGDWSVAMFPKQYFKQPFKGEFYDMNNNGVADVAVYYAVKNFGNDFNTLRKPSMAEILDEDTGKPIKRHYDEAWTDSLFEWYERFDSAWVAPPKTNKKKAVDKPELVNFLGEEYWVLKEDLNEDGIIDAIVYHEYVKPRFLRRTPKIKNLDNPRYLQVLNSETSEVLSFYEDYDLNGSMDKKHE
jgi:hypothetical protein